MTPVIMAIAQESYPENRALANGAYMALSFVIRSIVLVTFGAVSDRIGLHSSYILSAALLLAGLIFLPLFPKRVEQSPDLS
jgi:FSR family fosmidomycin resistance protein-like MFS transporter